MRTALVGKPLISFRSASDIGPVPQPGRVLERIDQHGKSLEMQWDDGLTLRTHMRFSGSWHLYRRGERWRRPSRHLVAAVEVENWVAVCFSAPVAELFRQFDPNRHPGSGGLGPSLRDVTVSLSDCARRLHHYPDERLALAEALLDERIVRGIGNVDRSELLWITSHDPWMEVRHLAPSDALQLMNAARRMHRRRVGDASFNAESQVAADLHVYGRNGQRCERCGETINVRRIGELRRLLYWCPGCQHAEASRRDTTDEVVRLVERGRSVAEQQFLADLPWRGMSPG